VAILVSIVALTHANRFYHILPSCLWFGFVVVSFTVCLISPLTAFYYIYYDVSVG